jgi:cytoskeletal protein CcmA (bactofilin family)
MGSITRSHSFVSGEKPTESEWNVDIDQLFTLISGQLDTNNVDTTSSDGVSVLNANQTVSGTRSHSGALTMTNDVDLIFGTDSDIKIRYDETTDDALRIDTGVNGAALAIVLKADTGDDAGDAWKVNLAASAGVLTFGNDIASKGSYVTQLTLTPNSTVASSTTAIAGHATVGGNLTVTGGVTVAGASAFDIGDSDKLLLGDSDDLQVYHNGTDSYIANSEGALNIATLTSGIAVTIGHGTSETTVADNLTVTGDISVDGNTASTSGTTGSIHTDGGLGVLLDLYVGDDLLMGSSGAVINFNSGDMTLTHSSNTLTVAGGTFATAALTATTITASGVLKTDDGTDATSTTDGSLQTDGGLSVAKDAILGNDVKLLTDSSVLSLGVGSDATLTHDGTTGVTIAANPIIVDSGDALTLDAHTGIFIFKDAGSEVLRFTEGNSGDVTIKLATNAKDLVFTDNGDATNMKILDAAAGINVPGEVQTTKIAYTDGDDAITIADGGGVTTSGTLTIGTVAAAGSDTDKFLVLDGSGNVDYRTGAQVLSDIGGAGSGSSTAADDISAGDGAVSIETTSGNITLDAQANDADVIIKVDDGGSAVTALTLDGSDEGNAIFVNDVQLKSDSALLEFGADLDTTLTHTDGTGLTLNSTNKLTFGDVASFIQQSADGTLTIDGEVIIDLNASTRVDVSGDLKVGGEVQTASIGYTDGDNAITIADGGACTFPQTGTFSGLMAAATMTLSSTSTISGDMTFGDNVKVTLGDGGDADLYYDGTDAILNPKVAGSGRLKILGDLGVGGTTGATNWAFTAELTVEGTYPGIFLKNTTSNEDDWAIGTTGGTLYIANDTDNDASLQINEGGDTTVSGGNLVIGTSGKGIDFAATGGPTAGTGTSELLDDYEEGTWTAALAAASGSITAVSSQDLMRYTKVGHLVTLQGDIRIESVSSPSGTLTMTGLPFAASNAGGELSDRTACAVSPAELTGSVNAICAQIDGGGVVISIYDFTGTTQAAMADHIQAGTEIVINLSYIV